MSVKRGQVPQSQSMFPQIENLQQFKQCLNMSLSKLSEVHTTKSAIDEVRELMSEHITNTDRMETFLYQLGQSNEYTKPHHKKELIKIYGMAAEVFEESLIPFIQTILSYLQKKLKENDSQLHVVISDSLGVLVHQTLKKIDSLDELLKEFNPILNQIFVNMSLPNKNMQIGSAMCLTRTIQNAPVIALQATLSLVSNKVLQILQSPSCKCHTQLSESLISLILAVEGDFSSHCIQFLPILLECMTYDEWTTRKMAIDVIYTMAAILKDTLVPYRNDILEVLNHCRTDKIKPVREATVEAIQAVKAINQDDDEVQVRDQSSFEMPERIRDNSPEIVQRNQPAVSNAQSYARKSQNVKSTRPPTSTKPKRAPVSKVNHTQEEISQDPNFSRKSLTSATYKKIQSRLQQQHQQPSEETKREIVPKKSIFSGPRNTGFFRQVSEQKDIEILEGPKPEESDQYQESLEDQEEEKIPRQDEYEQPIGVRIYESKRKAPYQDETELYKYLQKSANKELTTNQYKRVSPIKQNFVEDQQRISPQIRQDSSGKKQSPVSIGMQRSPQQIQQRSPLRTSEERKLMHQTFSMPQLHNQELLLPPQPPQQFSNEFSITSPTQLFNRVALTQPQPLPNLAAMNLQQNDQQLQFLLQEINKIHQNQMKMMEQVTEYQNTQKTEVFSLQMRVAKLEDLVSTQQQQIKAFQSQSLSNAPRFGLPEFSDIQNIDTSNQPHQRPKWNVKPPQQQPHTSLWNQINDKLQHHQTNEAYHIILSGDTIASSSEDKDLLLIKLIGRTGVCLNQLDHLTIEQLLNRIIYILSQKEFIDVLLPWVSSITKYFQEQNHKQSQLNLNSISNLVECLILLLHDQSSGGLNEVQRAEVEQIYLALSQNFK